MARGGNTSIGKQLIVSTIRDPITCHPERSHSRIVAKSKGLAVPFLIRPDASAAVRNG